jgi:hypothetical protein
VQNEAGAHDGGGGDCEADEREVYRGDGKHEEGWVCDPGTKQRFRQRSLIILRGTGKSFRCVVETPSEPKDESKFDM